MLLTETLDCCKIEVTDNIEVTRVKDMNISAYCRVSTEKEDQLNSLEAQKKFFAEYTSRKGDNYVQKDLCINFYNCIFFSF